MTSVQNAHLKNFFFGVLFIFTLSFCSTAQSKAVREINEAFRLGEEYWNKGDVEGYVSLYAPLDSSRMILGKGAAYGREGILAFYKKYWPKERMGHLVTDGLSSEKLSNKFYLTTGYFHVSYPDGKKVDGRFSVIMRKYKGRWYYYTDHSG